MCLLGGLSAQTTRFYASTEANEVVTNSTFRVEFTLVNGGDGRSFKAPRFDGFKVVGGPSRSSTDRLVNGQRSSERSWTYTLIATTPGRYTIDQASVRVGNATYRTKELFVEVLKANPNGSKTADYQFVLETDSTHYYAGEMIQVNYKLLAKKSVSGVSVLSEDTYDGLSPEVCPQRFNQRTEVIDGVQYNTLVFRQVILDAQKPGVYLIEPSIAKLEIPLGRRTSIWRQTKSETISSDSLRITVVPLPDTVDRKMATGDFNLECSLDNNVIKISDAIKLNIGMNGTGSLSLLGEPTIETMDKFEVFDPEITELATTYRLNQTRRAQLRTYALIPKEQTTSNIRVSIQYFDPRTKEVKEKSCTLKVRVSAGEAGLSESLATIQDEIADLDINHEKINSLSSHQKVFGSWGHILLLLGSVVPIYLSIKNQRKNKAWNALDPEERRKRKAWKKVASHFQEIEDQKNALSVRDYYDKAGHAFTSYLSQKLKINAADFSIHTVKHSLADIGADAGILERAAQLISLSQQSRFAPVDEAVDPTELFAQLKALVLDIEGTSL